MILLPSLIRLAAKSDDLGYQVAPGLAAVGVADLANAPIAARMAYLVDGDAEGDHYKRELLEAGVSATRIFSLPKGMAIEDLLDTGLYLETVRGLMIDAGWLGPLPTAADLDNDQPIALSLRQWCKKARAPEPGKTAVASRLIQTPADLKLKPAARRALAAFHQRVSKILAD